MSSLRLVPRSRTPPPPPPPGSALARRIAAQIAAGADDATIARGLRVARAHVAHVRAGLPAPPAEVLPAAPRPAWEVLSEAIARMILRQQDETERYHLRVAFLRARYTPWRDR